MSAKSAPSSTRVEPSPGISRELLLSLLQETPLVIYAKAADHRFILSNRQHANLLQREVHEIVGCTDVELFGAEALVVESLTERVLASGDPHVGEIELTLADGKRTFLETIFPLRDAEGALLGVGGIAADITARRSLEQELTRRADELEATMAELRRTQSRLLEQQRVAQITSECVQLVQLSTSIEEGLRVLARFTCGLFPAAHTVFYGSSHADRRLECIVASPQGAAPELGSEIDRSTCWALRTGRTHGAWRGGVHLRCRHASTDEREAQFCVPILCLDRVLGLLTVCFPVDEVSDEDEARHLMTQIGSFTQHVGGAFASIALRESLQHAAFTDELTGLPNRRALHEEGARTLARRQRSGGSFAFVLLNVVDFTLLNATHGYETGDEVLRRIAQAVVVSFGEDAFVARRSGAEFGVLVTDRCAEEVIERCRETQRAAVALAPPRVGAITLSVAIAHSDDVTANDFDTLAQRAIDNLLGEASRATGLRGAISRVSA